MTRELDLMFQVLIQSTNFDLKGWSLWLKLCVLSQLLQFIQWNRCTMCIAHIKHGKRYTLACFGAFSTNIISIDQKVKALKKEKRSEKSISISIFDEVFLLDHFSYSLCFHFPIGFLYWIPWLGDWFY